MSTQLLFDFKITPQFDEQNFFISAPNQDAVNWVKKWPDWPSRGIIICGKEGSGKTHLAHIFRDYVGGVFLKEHHLKAHTITYDIRPYRCYIIDDLENWKDESLLFHVYNSVMENEAWLVILTTQPPELLNIKLPDLKSRLLALPIVTIKEPDDQMVSIILMKYLSDFQIKMSEESFYYIQSQLPKTFVAIKDFTNELNRLSLTYKKNISLTLIRKVISKVKQKST